MHNRFFTQARGHNMLRKIVLLIPFFNIIIAPPLMAQMSTEDILAAIVDVNAKIPEDARTATSLGTERAGNGVVINSNGLILTIGYLILEASSVTVTTNSKKSVEADVVAYDHDTGFGLLRPRTALDIKPIELGRSASIQQGDPAIVIAFGGAEAAMPVRVVARRNYPGYWEYLLENAIFSAPAHPRYGGAALIGSEHTLLGIGSLVLQDMRAGLSLPVNMFVPVDALKPILDDLLKFGRTRGPHRPWIGLYSDEHRGHVIVTRLATGGPAAQAGVQPNDIILKVGGEAVSDLADFYRKLWKTGNAGTEIQLDVLRKTEILPIKVRSTDRYQWLKMKPEGKDRLSAMAETVGPSSIAY